MAFLLVLATVLSLALGESMNFSPSIIEDMDHHKGRVWVWLNQKCFEKQDSVLSFKDYLLTQYQCINFDTNRKTIFKHPTSKNTSVWSLWLEKNAGFYDFDCLNDNITLPTDVPYAECISGVYYEPTEHIDDCTDQPTSSSLWSLDIMDGIFDNQYRYFDYVSTTTTVEAIILDTDVDSVHVEFSGLNGNNLFTGTPAPTMSQSHGTHVAGTVVGHTVGGAKNTDYHWYPVCQLGSSCAWSDIEGGYEAAINLMMSNPNNKYVINYSVGGSRTSSNEAAYDSWGLRIQSAGGFWVTSAGNSGSNACNFAPAFSTYAVTVGAYNSGLAPSTWFTNYGSCVDTWGPGESVYSATPGDGYGLSSGTSMASPNIAALVINLIKGNPAYTLDGIKSYLMSNAQSLNNVPPNYGSATRAYWNSGC